MALLSKKEVEAAAPAPATMPATPKGPPPSPSVPAPAPKPIPLLMARDGGLNGRCWRGGDTVLLDPTAADFYLAKGHATRAP